MFKIVDKANAGNIAIIDNILILLTLLVILVIQDTRVSGVRLRLLEMIPVFQCFRSEVLLYPSLGHNHAGHDVPVLHAPWPEGTVLDVDIGSEVVLFPKAPLVSRPRRRQGLLYKHLCH